MKHLAVIQAEFLKEAREWRDLSYGVQREYLRQHPKSMKRLTSRPDAQPEETQMPEAGDRVIVQGDWKTGYGSSSYEADVVDILGDKAIVRDDSGQKTEVPLVKLDLKMSTKSYALAASS